jgi:hypothetical protein
VASGIWYKNDSYKLRVKGNEIELTKDGKTIAQRDAIEADENIGSITDFDPQKFL